MALAIPAPQKKPWAFEDIFAAPPATTNRPATFAPPADTTTNRPAPAAPVATRPRPATRLSADAARAQLGGRPIRNEGESIGSFNQRLGRFHRQFSNLTTGTTARDRAQLANAFAAQGNEADAQLAWWNGADYFNANQLPAGYQGGSGGAGGSGTAGGAGGAGGQPGAGGGAEVLKAMLPYDDATIQRLSGEAASKRASDLEQSQEELFLAGARGGSFQPAAQAQAAAATQAARSGLSSDIGGIKNEAIKANYAATQQQLDRALEAKRLDFQDRWQNASDDTARAQIAMQWQIAEAEIQAQKDAAANAAAQAGASAGRGRAWDLEDREWATQREDELYYRQLPFLMAQYTDL